MVPLPANTRIVLAIEPVDMRKHFDSLWAVAKNTLGENPKTGNIFAFANKARTRCKILFWDGTGICVLAKRLEKGTFSWPKNTKPKIIIEPTALTMLLDGVDLKNATLRPWYERDV
jgi:transposase